MARSMNYFSRSRVRFMSEKDIEYVMDAHSGHPKRPFKLAKELHDKNPGESYKVSLSRAFRKFDGKTPFYIHPIWCATTIATETKLDETVRNEGIMALLYHDLLEDTTKELPEWLSPRIEYLVKEMTFEDGSKQEMEEIWNKPNEVKLYKLYDKVSNLLDGSWMDETKRKNYENYTGKLCEEIKKMCGDLNIVKMGEQYSHLRTLRKITGEIEE